MNAMVYDAAVSWPPIKRAPNLGGTQGAFGTWRCSLGPRAANRPGQPVDAEDIERLVSASGREVPVVAI